MDCENDLVNKVALVTGSSSGIGEGIALLFAKLGMKVVVTGRNETKIKEVVGKCDKVSPNNAKALGLVGDVAVDADVHRIVEQTIQKFGQIDVLVNNAGIGQMSTIDDPKTMEIFDKIMNTNVRALMLFCHLVVPHLLKAKGSIVNISSVISTRPYVGFTSYGATKAAVDMITKNLALELGPKGIRVNSVNPGAVRTGFITAQGIPEAMSDSIFDEATASSPLGLVGLPHDIAHMVAFLASNKKAAFITGETFLVDGGYKLMGPKVTMPTN